MFWNEFLVVYLDTVIHNLSMQSLIEELNFFCGVRRHLLICEEGSLRPPGKDCS